MTEWKKSKESVVLFVKQGQTKSKPTQAPEIHFRKIDGRDTRTSNFPASTTSQKSKESVVLFVKQGQGFFQRT
jgi:hypothetical protein